MNFSTVNIFNKQKRTEELRNKPKNQEIRDWGFGHGNKWESRRRKILSYLVVDGWRRGRLRPRQDNGQPLQEAGPRVDRRGLLVNG